jgi:hypothetical protein
MKPCLGCLDTHTNVYASFTYVYKQQFYVHTYMIALMVGKASGFDQSVLSQCFHISCHTGSPIHTYVCTYVCGSASLSSVMFFSDEQIDLTDDETNQQLQSSLERRFN